MTQDEIKDWRDSMVNIAKNNLLRDGLLAPVTLMLIEKDGEIAMGVYNMNMESAETKNNDVMQIRMVTSTNKVLALLMLSETWFKTPSDEEIESGNYIAPSESDDKDEAIMVTLETNAFSEIMLHKIIRDESEKITDFELIGNGLGGTYVGRFTNMLAKLN
jgi:hypothetical protein